MRDGLVGVGLVLLEEVYYWWFQKPKQTQWLSLSLPVAYRSRSQLLQDHVCLHGTILSAMKIMD